MCKKIAENIYNVHKSKNEILAWSIYWNMYEYRKYHVSTGDEEAHIKWMHESLCKYIV